MSRKSAISELQSEEVTNSPLRRSTRIVNGNGAGAAAIGTRRTSQTTESDIPAKATRGRRSSAQSVEDNSETKLKRASTLPEQEPQKEATPARRGRKPSITADPSEKEPEKPKPVRARRSSRAGSEDNEEKPQKSAPVRGRRNSATADSEPEVKAAAVKTPARATTRRRSSATDNEVSTPVKRTTRSRRASETEDFIEEVKKPSTRGRKKSINQEEETKIEEVVAKPTSRRGRKSSTDNLEVDAAPKTPGRSTRRTSVDLKTEEKMDEVTEKEISPASLKDMTIKLTPLKKRKLLDKVEAELDLSIINESGDDIDSSKEEELLKDDNLSKTVDDKKILRSSPSSKKRLSDTVESPRKSPRLTEKLSNENTSKKETSPEVKMNVNNLISSGSDGSFRFHMSNISITNNTSQENVPDSVLNTSKESTGSNKENEDNVEKSPVPVPRISNVFKPNQKEYSFMEPMDVDMSIPLESFMLDKDESSVIFNRNTPKRDSIIHQEEDTKRESLNAKNQHKILDDLRSNLTETEGSDNNIIIEETDETVDIGIRPNNNETNTNNPVVLIDKVKVMLTGTSSSPLRVKRRSLRKTKSPPETNHSTDSESESRENIRISKPNRWSKTKSETPSPTNNLLSKPRLSKSRSKSPNSPISHKTNAPPDAKSQKYNDSLISGNVASRSKSISPVQPSGQTIERTENGLDQSFEKFKGSEEVSMSNEILNINILNDGQEFQDEKETPIKRPDLEEQDSIISKEKNTRNNDTEIKHSDSTHYDFDLPSDDDDDDELLNSETNNSVNDHKNTSSCENESRNTIKESSERAESDLDDVFEEKEDASLSVGEIKEPELDEESRLEKSTGNEKSETISDCQEPSINSSLVSKESELLKDSISTKIDELPKGDSSMDKITVDEILTKSIEECNDEGKNSPTIVGKTKMDVNNSINEEPSKCLDDILVSKCEINNVSPKNDNIIIIEKDKLINDSPSIINKNNKVSDDKENLKPKLESSPSFSSASTEDIKNVHICDDREEKQEQETSLEKSENIEKVISSKSNEISTTEEDAKNIQAIKMDIKPVKSIEIEDHKPPIKSRSSLDEFASAKLSEYLKTKAEEFEESSSEADSNEGSESEKDYNEFIDGMAEEGEEDTPSEDSNQIIDEGESVGSSDSEYAGSEEYDENDSFICDDEEPVLLSGEEYDLSGPKKKSRIIDASTLGEEDIIKIPKKTVDKDVPKKKSRIIMISDSSSEEETNIEPKTEQTSFVQESKELLKESETSNLEDITVELKEKPEENSENENNKESILQNLQKRHRKSSLSIQENIIIDGLKDPMISKKINNLVESFCSTVTKGEISLNLSLEYEDPPDARPPNETEPIHIISDVKICPGTSSDKEYELQNTSQNVNELNNSASQCGDLREVLNKKKLKRKLSKSLTEVYEEEKKTKKRRKNKKSHKIDQSEEQLKAGSLGLMNQLITDVKNRPKRIIKPTTTDPNSSWIITKVQDPKPSTSPASKHERIKVVPKLHPKDFKNRLLTDPKRVKRVETKTLLKKKGAFL